MKVLIVAAHPSDEVLGCGGTIAKHSSNGDDVSVCIFCKSPQASYTKEMVKRLKIYNERASKILGIGDSFILNFKPMEINSEPMLKLVRSIENVLSKTKPDVVYTHHRGDVHFDHKIIFDATMAATRSFGDNIVKKILCYEVPSSTFWAPPFVGYNFTPNVFIDISQTIDKKMKAMQAYKSEIRDYPHPRSLEVLRLKAKIWGIKTAAREVEAFELVREIS